VTEAEVDDQAAKEAMRIGRLVESSAGRRNGEVPMFRRDPSFTAAPEADTLVHICSNFVLKD
jgi:hypothetical protein